MILTAQPNAYWQWTHTWERRLKVVENKTADIWQVVQCTRLGTPANTHSQMYFNYIKWSIVYTPQVLTSSLPRGSQDMCVQKGAMHAEGERDQHLWGNCAREITISEKEDWVVGRWEKTEPEAFAHTVQPLIILLHQLHRCSPTKRPITCQWKIIKLKLNSDEPRSKPL